MSTYTRAQIIGQTGWDKDVRFLPVSLGEPLPPLVIAATGEDTWTITAPGTGEPVYYALEFDDEAEIEWLRENTAAYAEALDAYTAPGRTPDAAIVAEMRRGLAAERERIAEYEAEMHAGAVAP